MKLTKTVLDYDALDVITESALYGLSFAQSQNDAALFNYHLATATAWRVATEVDAARDDAVRYADQRMVIEYHAEGTPMVPVLIQELKEFDLSRVRSV